MAYDFADPRFRGFDIPKLPDSDASGFRWWWWGGRDFAITGSTTIRRFGDPAFEISRPDAPRVRDPPISIFRDPTALYFDIPRFPDFMISHLCSTWIHISEIQRFRNFAAPRPQDFEPLMFRGVAISVFLDFAISRPMCCYVYIPVFEIPTFRYFYFGFGFYESRGFGFLSPPRPPTPAISIFRGFEIPGLVYPEIL